MNERPTISPFDAVQLAQILAKIIEAEGKDSDGVWQIIQQAMEKMQESEGDKRSPKIRLQQAVVEILEECDEPDLLLRYREYCEQHNDLYQSLHKVSGETITPQSGEILVGPTTNDEYLPWERSRIAHALQKEGGIPLDVAEEVAREVERKVLRSGSRYITTALIRELANSELFLKGHRYSLKKQSVLGIPKYNLNKLLYAHERTAMHEIAQLSQHVASIALRQYAFEEVFSPEVIERHLEGAIHIEGLEWPVKFYTLAIPPPSRSGLGEIDDACEWAAVLQSQIHQLSSTVTHSLCLTDIDASKFAVAAVRALLASISQNYTHTSLCHLLLQDPFSDFCRRLYPIYYEAFQRHKKDSLPHLFFPLVSDYLGRKKPLEKLLQQALEIRTTTFLFDNPSFFHKNSYLPRECAMDAIAINLMQAACKAGKGQYDKFWQELKEVFSIVVKAHLDKKRFLLNLREGPLRQFFREPLAAMYKVEEFCCFLQISGLPETIRFLSGSDMFKEQGWELAIQTLAYLADLVQNIEERHGIQVRLVHYNCREASERFVKLDLAHFPEAKAMLEEPVYTPGPHFSWKNQLTNKMLLQKEGQLHQYVASYVSLTPEITIKELRNLLKFAMDETEVMAIRIR